MQEFTTVSSTSYEPAALAARLTEKSAEGWNVVSILNTGTEVTAFLARSTAPDAAVGGHDDAPSIIAAAEATAATNEPAGWAVSPVSTSSPAATAAAPAAPAYVPAAVTTAAATPSVPAGWYADPSARYELRYWDGTEWTEHVSRAGQQYTDPPVR